MLTEGQTIIGQVQAGWRRARRSAVFFGTFATAVRTGANLLLLPILLTRVSTAELAVWWVFLALGGLANLADFGFGPAISRVYSFLWAGAEDFQAQGLRAPPKTTEPNLPKIRELASAVRYLYWRLSFAAALLLGSLGTLALLKPMQGMPQPELAWLAWGGYVLTVGYALGTSSWIFACQGIGRVRELQAAYTFGGLVYLFSATALLMGGAGLLAVVAANALRGIVIRQYCRRVYYEAVPAVPGREPPPDRSMLKRLWPNAYKLGLISLGAFLVSNGNVIICSHFLGKEMTASFGLTVQVGTFMMNFAALWLAVKWPEITMLRTQGRLEDMATLFARRLALTMATFLLSAVAIVVTGNWLLSLKGTHTKLLQTGPLIFYFSYLTQQLFYVQFGSLAYTENVVPFFRIAICTGIGVFVSSWLMTWQLGLWGMLVAPLIVESAYSSWFTVRRGFQGQPFTPGRLLAAALSGHFKQA